MSLIEVSADGTLSYLHHRYRCALGRAGVVGDKHEGDGGTPAGEYALHRVLYRADRIDPPVTSLPIARIGPRDGWCDAASDAAYNQPVRLPYSASAEALWRDDALYDLVVILGFNDAPVVAGHGSAIFMHVAGPDFGPTEGCVALALDDLRRLLSAVGPGARIAIRTSAAG